MQVRLHLLLTLAMIAPAHGEAETGQVLADRGRAQGTRVDEDEGGARRCDRRDSHCGELASALYTLRRYTSPLIGWCGGWLSAKVNGGSR